MECWTRERHAKPASAVRAAQLMRPPPQRRQTPWNRVPALALIFVGIVAGVLLALPTPRRGDPQKARLPISMIGIQHQTTMTLPW